MDDTNDNRLHRRTWEAIPWVVSGRAGAAERDEVEAHLATCDDCRAEFAFQRQLHGAMQASGGAPGDAAGTGEAHDPAPALARLWSRIDAAEGAPFATPAVEHRVPRRLAGWTGWLAAAVVVEAIGLAALLGVMSERPKPADYQTLTSAAAPLSPAATIRLVPAPTLPLRELGELLLRSGVQIVDSSGDGGIFGVAARPGVAGSADELLVRLRREPGVLLAEPIGPAPAQR